MLEEGTALVKPSEVVVIHPGSKNLRVGLATDTSPRVFPHCVARRRKAFLTAEAAEKLKSLRIQTNHQYLPPVSIISSV